MYSNPNYAGGGLHHSLSHSSHRGYQSGYGYPPGPPPGADPQLWQWFTTVDADRSGSISVAELQAALVNGSSFSLFLHGCGSDGFRYDTGNWSSECPESS
jgi:hypothetical protein